MSTKQMTKQNISNMNLLDNLMKGISTAEKLVYGANSSEKKYGYYDVKNSAAWKTIPELKAECLCFKNIIKGDIEDFRVKYRCNFKFPTNLSKYDILSDLERFSEIARTRFPDNKDIITYYTEMINIIQGTRDDKVFYFYSLNDYPNIKCPDCKRGINYLANEIYNYRKNAEQQIEENEKQVMENDGKFKYYAKLNIPPGRLGNRGNDISEYYKKPGDIE